MQLDVESKEALEDLLSKVGALLPVGNKQCTTADAQGNL